MSESQTTAKVTATRLAGDDHAVLTVEGGAHTYRRQPCDKCPWRKDAAGEFPAEAFRHSAATARHTPDGDGRFIHTFGCHSSGACKPAMCAGYILRGSEALSWRIALTRGLFDPSKVDDGGVELFDNYADMAIGNGVAQDDPALVDVTALQRADPSGA